MSVNSKAWSSLPTKPIPIGTDVLAILDSEEGNPVIKNKTITISSLFTGAGGLTSINGDTTPAQIIAAGTGLGIINAGATHTLSIDSTVATLTGTQILTNKTITSPIISMGTNKITGLGDPTLAQDAATKNYVDTFIPTSPWTKSGNFIFPTTLTDKIGIGVNTPLAPVHIRSSAVGTITLGGDADDFVIENKGNEGYTIAPTVVIAPPPTPITATGIAVLGTGVGSITPVTAGGSGYTNGETVTLTGTGSGATGTITVVAGAVTAVSIVNIGSGYTNGETLSIVSALSGTGATGTNIATQFVSSIIITNTGLGYVTAPIITIDAATGSNPITATATSSLVNTSMTVITITNGGQGYTGVPGVVISAAPAAVNATATANISGGKVTSVTITNGGVGYHIPPSVVTFTGGNGNGVGVDTVSVANSSITSITVTSGGTGLSIVSAENQVGKISFIHGGAIAQEASIVQDHSTERMRFIQSGQQGLIIDSLGHVAVSQDNVNHAEVFTVDTDVLNVPVRLLIRDSFDRLMLGYNGVDSFKLTATEAQVIVPKDTGDLIIASRGNLASKLLFYTSAGSALVERMRINSNGSLEINNSIGANPVLSSNSATQDLLLTGNLQVSGTGKFTSTLDMTSQLINNVLNPVSAQDAATKNYVDSFVQGTIKWKEPVIVATTANITLSGEQTIDGILTSADRILVKNQTLGQNDGIYVTATGAWIRATDFDASNEILNAAVWVSQGTVNADQAFVCTTDLPITVGTTPLVFVQFSGLGQIITGTNLSKTANTINWDPTGGVDLLTNNLTNAVIVTPTIASFVNATHNHQVAAGGGTLVATSALTATGTKDSTTFLRGDDTWATPLGSIPPFTDTTAIVKGSADATKLLRFEVDGNTTGITGVIATSFTTAKTITIPDATDTLVGKATTDTLTNKTLITPTIASFTNAIHNHSNAAGGGNLTNSALTSGVFAAITGLGTQTQALNMNSNLINSVTDPVLAQDAATKNYVDSNFTTTSDVLTNLTLLTGNGTKDIKATENVGRIFVTSDYQELKIKGIPSSTFVGIRFQDSSNNTTLEIFHEDSLNQGGIFSSDALTVVATTQLMLNGVTSALLQSTSGNVTFNTAAIERMKITPTGNVTIDTNTLFVDAVNNRVGINTTPTVPFDVVGAMKISSTLNTHTIPSGTDTFAMLAAIQTLTNKTLITPTIASFTNATHNHQAASGGNPLVATSALTATGIKDSTTFLRGDNTWATPAGVGDMVLAGIQTVTGKKTFGTIGAAVGKFALAGSTSGSTILNAAAVAGAGTVVLPTTGTLATLAGTETLLSKTLTIPTIVATGFINMQHTHQATNTGSQLIATLALTATGTKDATTFLRGDDTWTTPAGSGDMVLAGIQTVTGKKTFGTIGAAVGKFALAGSTSGSTILNAAAVAGAGTVVLPTTGTLATLAGTEILSLKTLITPTIASFVNATHNHQAASGGSPLVATSALTATGTKDSTTFLRGDDTWATPAAGEVFTWTANHNAANFQLDNVDTIFSDFATQASTGFMRMGHTQQLAWRNAANDGNDTIDNASNVLRALGFTAGMQIQKYTAMTTGAKAFATNGAGVGAVGALALTFQDTISFGINRIDIETNQDGADNFVRFVCGALDTAEIHQAKGIRALGRFTGAKSVDIASADKITMLKSNYADITGTTQINHISNTEWDAGSFITLQFDASVTLTHQTGGATGDEADMFLAGAVNALMTANDTITLVFDGLNWRETARSVN